jgi:hypothetical protein
MILHFEAEAVEIEENDPGIVIVGFYTEENYLMIQQSLDGYDEQDVRLGMNTYHIERDDQSLGGYGGVAGISVSRNSLAVELDKTGKENLQCDAVRVDFQDDSVDFELLSEKLRLIFGDALSVEK